MSRDASADQLLQGEIERLTRRLRLPCVRAAAPELLKSARSQRWDPAEALRVLLEEEVAGRDKSDRETRRQTTAFPHQKTFHTWREGASSIPLHVQHALRALECIERRENLILCGASGTGKSHFLDALGQAAIDRDLRVAWFTLEDLGSLMRRHRFDDTNARAIKRINRADLICIHDIGHLPTSPDAAEGFFRVIDVAYERRSLAISGNLHPSNYDTIMPKTLAAAAVDRLLHHAHVFQVDGDSFRLKEATAGTGVRNLNNQPGRTHGRPWGIPTATSGASQEPKKWRTQKRLTRVRQPFKATVSDSRARRLGRGTCRMPHAFRRPVTRRRRLVRSPRAPPYRRRQACTQWQWRPRDV